MHEVGGRSHIEIVVEIDGIGELANRVVAVP
jgi:hypothetical protein